MISAMLLAHILGDYVLQTDRLAHWKSRRLAGVLCHGGIVTAVTWLLSLAYDPAWWPWALFIGLTHTAIDAAKLRIGRVTDATALKLFLVDQASHGAVLLATLSATGYVSLAQIANTLAAWLHDDRLLAFVLGYSFLTMPAWVLIHFVVRGLVIETDAQTTPMANKYVGIVERGLMATFVLMGQYLLIPLAAIPRLVFDRPQPTKEASTTGYVAELLIGTALSVAVGVGLRRM